MATIAEDVIEQVEFFGTPTVTRKHDRPPVVVHASHEPEAADRWRWGVDWPIAFWIGLLHVGALAAPFVFTWKGIGLVVLLGWMTGGLGICLGYHRLLSHSSFGTSKWMRWAIAFLGGLAGQGSAVTWVANHRKHHAFSDHDGDPHTPRDGAWWSHWLWFLPRVDRASAEALHRRWAPDLAADPVMRFLDRTFIVWNVGLGVLLFTLGWAFWGSYTGWSFVVYGMFVRLVYVLHSTWFVNSATHLWGYRNYETDDDSRNLWWVALLTYGEGWHNNHHAHPRMARHGHKWWEVDSTFAAIWLLERLGLATNVVRTHSRRARGVSSSKG